MQQFNRYQDDEKTRIQLILSRAFKVTGCDKVAKELKKLVSKLG